MARVIRFRTSRFDISKERSNPINPIAGESLLLWLRERAQHRVDIPVPEAEDWGWYAYVDWEGRSYLLGASVTSGDGEMPEWVLQMEKCRSVKEKILGQARETGDDPCFAFFQGLIEAEPDFHDVSVDSER